MVDYSSWKVAELKAEIKKHNVPLTGLRLKQQCIDKLMELDSQTDKTETAAAPEENASPQRPGPDAIPLVPESQPEKPQSEQSKQLQEEPTVQEKESPAPISVSDKAYDEEKQANEPDEGHIEAATNVKSQEIEGDAKPTEEAHIKDIIPEKEQSPAATSSSPAIEAIQTAKKEAPLKPEEKSTPSALQTSEVDTGLSTPLPAEEALEDTRKRKRRSQSPAPTLEEVANRKARAKETTPHVLLKDDEENNDQKSAGYTLSESQRKTSLSEKQPNLPKLTGKQDARFRGLFAPTGVSPHPSSPPRDIAIPDADMGPALHPATASLYIDGLMRPLQPSALRKHLSSLASAPETSSDSDPIVEFYLDSIKTHCFVRFTSITVASRVRSAVHGTVWPYERNRKNLRADFIPDDKVKEWIETEEKSSDRAGAAPRWEVRYETSDEGITATLAEVGSAPTGRRESGFNRTPPLGPRSDIERFDRRPSNPAPAPAPRPGQGFKPLDELFKSTNAKPKLYYLPVPRPVADKRLDQFDELIQKGTFPRRGGDEMRRITFEDEDQFVDIGPERFGPGPRSGPGPRGRGRGGRRGEFWRS
ncbi:uncharacterized protein N7529_011042 [Penicillium soppii]|uniref:uncharacterized protein n=1 Tax=Penicillium soppii TaxID=69789 RepID=UPI0025486A57|nr:uncharacterized protein N7529_011042 [Penicillium soppii]KAJ5851657.1 hypothetical protein N7529_011042 [Penicillium soppii]